MKNLRKLVVSLLRSRKQLDEQLEIDIRQSFFDIMAIYRQKFEAEDEMAHCNKAIVNSLAKVEMARASSPGVDKT